MRFNSLVYVAFLAISALTLWSLPARLRRWWLLLASWVFYASWSWPFLGLLIGVGLLNQLGGRWICTRQNRRPAGAVIVTLNILVLILFKYADWLLSVIGDVARAVDAEWRTAPLDWVLPLGLSFYVFEGISYTIDIVRKRETPRMFWEFQLYIAFFPHLIAGPIMRAKELIPQLQEAKSPRLGQLRDGVWMLLSGMFVKIVLADGIAPQVDAAFARAPQALGAPDVWVMTIAFGLQIYLDFSSYSRIALGSSKLCGLELVENFDFPYSARNPVDFWARWHMSLSRWIRDYLFYPLVGRKSTPAALVRAALISMGLCGIWHGAGWTFLLWGLYHGLLIGAYHSWGYWRKRRASAGAPSPSGAVETCVGIPATFLAISLGWVLFRSTSVGQAASLISTGLNPFLASNRALPGTFYLHTFSLLAAVWSAPLVARAMGRLRARAEASLKGDLAWHLGLGVAAGLCFVLGLVYLKGQTSFIYFQF